MSVFTKTWSVVVESSLLLVIRGCLFFPRFEVTNYSSFETLAEFLNELFAGTLWSLAFHSLFPGQIIVFMLLGFYLLFALWLAKGRVFNLREFVTFHLVSICWILLPVLALEFGAYRGP